MSVVKYNRPLMPRWNNFFDGFFPEDNFFSKNNLYNSMPAANIEEDDNAFVIKMAVPGVDKDDISIEIRNNIITISSEKEESKEETDKEFTRKEYSFNSFSRTFNLPQNIKEDKIEANYKNGELILQIPKANPPINSAKKIKVA